MYAVQLQCSVDLFYFGLTVHLCDSFLADELDPIQLCLLQLVMLFTICCTVVFQEH